MSRAQLTSTVEQSSGGVVAPFLAGKNKIINGDFGIWQRGTSFSNPTAGYTADRFSFNYDNKPTTHTISQVAFDYSASPASDKLPIAGQNGTYFYRSAITTTGTCTVIDHTQKIEDVHTLSGNNITISFWAKADSARTFVAYVAYVFGTGGSSSTYPFTSSATSVGTTWTRYSFTFSTSIIGSSIIGPGSYIQVSLRQTGASGSTIDTYGWQYEAGSVATPFTTASGTLQGELALCQRYLPAFNSTGTASALGPGLFVASTDLRVSFNFPVTPRVAPTGVTVSSPSHFTAYNGTLFSPSAISYSYSSLGMGVLSFTVTGGTNGISANASCGNASGQILFTGCEL